MNNYEHFAKGFIKTALAKNMAISDFITIVKQAVMRPDELTYEDISRIKKDMAVSGDQVPYNDVDGHLKREYLAKLLARRDEASDSIPVIEGGLHGLKKGLIGAGLGYAGGYGAGVLARESSVLNLPKTFKRHLPVGMGATTAAVSGILSALPAALHRYEAAKAYKKLDYSKNLAEVEGLNRADTSMLNS
jgi:hypothetical protein